jgi:hypothetical protein
VWFRQPIYPGLISRYLIDTDQEVEGLAVIADFQGAALDDELVLAEYKEIRDAVVADVSPTGDAVGSADAYTSGRLVTGHTELCGDGIKLGYSSL